MRFFGCLGWVCHYACSFLYSTAKKVAFPFPQHLPYYNRISQQLHCSVLAQHHQKDTGAANAFCVHVCQALPPTCNRVNKVLTVCEHIVYPCSVFIWSRQATLVCLRSTADLMLSNLPISLVPDRSEVAEFQLVDRCWGRG